MRLDEVCARVALADAIQIIGRSPVMRKHHEAMFMGVAQCRLVRRPVRGVLVTGGMELETDERRGREATLDLRQDILGVVWVDDDIAAHAARVFEHGSGDALVTRAVVGEDGLQCAQAQHLDAESVCRRDHLRHARFWDVE